MSTRRAYSALYLIRQVNHTLPGAPVSYHRIIKLIAIEDAEGAPISMRFAIAGESRRDPPDCLGAQSFTLKIGDSEHVISTADVENSSAFTIVSHVLGDDPLRQLGAAELDGEDVRYAIDADSWFDWRREVMGRLAEVVA